jgi:hypothetical protein
MLLRRTGTIREDCPLHLVDKDGELRRVIFSSEEAAKEYGKGYAALTERVGLGGWVVASAPVDRLRADLPVFLDPNITIRPGRHISLYELL